MTNYESIKNMSIEDMAKMNVKAFMYMNGYRTNVAFLIQERKRKNMN